MMHSAIIAFALLLIPVATCDSKAIATLASVTIRNGTLIGLTDAQNGVQKFLGVPFAEPPVGDLRLSQAVPLKKSFGTRQAAAFGPACINAANAGNASEDCLTLNIWRPIQDGVENGSLPVLIWLYGGGLTSGYTADPTFEGTAITRIAGEIGKPIILVTVNYRLGPFGFLNGKEMAELGLLNIGMLDQRLAFRWIQDNIAAFGGNPARVTLAGESAGAVSIYSHLMAYGGRDDKLFHGIILESGGAFPLTRPDTPAFQSTFDSLITQTSCANNTSASAADKLSCIRNLPLATFRAKVGRSTGQSIDGTFSRTSIQRALPAGAYIKVPTIIGANTDEGKISAPTGINSIADLAGPVADGFFRPQKLPNATVSALIDLYTTDARLGCPYNTGSKQFTSGKLDKMACSIFGDIVQIAPARMIALALAQDGVPVYKYRFNHLPSGTLSSRGIGTGIEQSYVFSNSVPTQAWDQNLAYQMSSLWATFAHDLDPNGVGQKTELGLPIWPKYDERAEAMVFNGYGSWVEKDTYRAEAIRYIIEKVLPDGAL